MQALLSYQHCSVSFFNEAPHLDMLGAPIGDYLHCANFIAAKCNEAVKLSSKIKEIAAMDHHNMLCMCGAFCNMVNLARSTSPKPGL